MRIFKTIGIGLVICLFFAILYAHDLPRTPFHSDEMAWPCMDKAYRLLVSGQWHTSEWYTSAAEFTTGPIPRYMYSFWQELTQITQLRDTIGCRDWPKYIGLSMYDLAPIETTFLLHNRKLNLIFALGTLLLVFLVSMRFFKTSIAVLSVIVLGFQPLYRSYATRAMTEMMLLFWLWLGIWIMSTGYKSDQHTHMRLRSFFMGFIAGLATMTKPYGVMILLAWWVWVLWQQSLTIRKKADVVILSLVPFFASLLILYPPFLLNPFDIGQWVSGGVGVQNWLVKMYPHDALNSIPQKLLAIGRVTIWGNSTEVFVRLGFILAHINGWWWLILVILRSKRKEVEKIILSVVSAFFIMTVTFLRLNWDRYYLPLISAFILIQTYGVWKFMDIVKHFNLKDKLTQMLA